MQAWALDESRRGAVKHVRFVCLWFQLLGR